MWISSSKLKALMVAGDMSAIHPSSWRNGLASETRLSTPFKKILAMVLPSVAKREPESSELSSSDLSNIIDLYEDDLPASAALDTELHCWDVKWRGKIEEAKCNDSPSKAMRETDTDFRLNIYQLLLIACTLPVTRIYQLTLTELLMNLHKSIKE